jgi:hypothetical protein
VGAEIEPVAKSLVAQAQGLEKMREQLRHDSAWRRLFLQSRLILDDAYNPLIRKAISTCLHGIYQHRPEILAGGARRPVEKSYMAWGRRFPGQLSH